MEEWGELLRLVGMAGYLLVGGNLFFWCVLIYRAGENVLPTELVLFATGAVFFAAATLSVALPVEWRLPLVNTARVAALGLGIAFTAHTYNALQHRIDMTQSKLTDEQRARIEEKIAAFRELLTTTTDEAKREHILFEIRALELLLDEG